jgi:hypothetical protein
MDALQTALAKKQALERESRKLDEYIAAKRAVDALEQELGLANDNLQVNEPTSKNLEQRQPQKATRDNIRSIAKTSIVENGSQSIQKIIEKIEDQGLRLNAKNPISYVSQILSLDEDFVSNRKTGWSLKSFESQAQKGESLGNSANANSHTEAFNLQPTPKEEGT